MINVKNNFSGVILSGVIAVIAYIISSFLPSGILGGTLIALLLGMLLNPLICHYNIFDLGISFTSKKILRTGIILAGITLSFPQVIKAGKYALLLMMFTLATSFGVGYQNETEELKLDVYYPANDETKKRRAIIMVHGGGFVSFTRKQEYIVGFAKEFAKLGYVCFSPEYRLYKKGERPSLSIAAANTAVDIELARQFIIKNADEFGIDAYNIAIMGGSAGGMASNEACKTKNAYRAFVCLWGAPQTITNPEQYPDTLIIHGTEDKSVDYSLSENLLSKLTKNNVYSELITVDGAGHTPFSCRGEYLPRMITFVDEKMK